MTPRLYLIPNTISQGEILRVMSTVGLDIVKSLRSFFVEEIPPAQRFLKKIYPEINFDECEFFVISEHTSLADTKRNFERVKGKDIGLMVEVGCPCVADSGEELVLLAHQNDMRVIPLVGPSSVVLALMASGLNGQNFAFVGYLPKEKQERFKKLKELERRSFREKQTQIFMEAPYRNENLFQEIISALEPQTLLCVAADLTGPEEYIKTLQILNWRKIKPSLHKKPTLFLIQKQKL